MGDAEVLAVYREQQQEVIALFDDPDLWRSVEAVARIIDTRQAVC